MKIQPDLVDNMVVMDWRLTQVVAVCQVGQFIERPDWWLHNSVQSILHGQVTKGITVCARDGQEWKRWACL